MIFAIQSDAFYNVSKNCDLCPHSLTNDSASERHKTHIKRQVASN